MACEFCSSHPEQHEKRGYCFTGEEIAMLRASFEVIKTNHETVSIQILNRISEQVAKAVETFQKAVHSDDLNNRFISTHLGMLVLSGIERCLLRLECPHYLRDCIVRLKTKHRQNYTTPPDVIVRAIRASEPVIVRELNDRLGVSPKRDDVWETFFDEMCILIMSPTTD